MSTANNTHLIVLSVGDSDCGDGHGMNRKFYILTNVDQQALLESYTAGVEVIGVDIDELTQEYEANKIDAESIAKLSASGFDVSTLDPRFGIGSWTYLEIFMHTATCGHRVLHDPPADLSWNSANIVELEIGGYGVIGR
jgi:hypothetical protein